jgi:hypothetical protein
VEGKILVNDKPAEGVALLLLPVGDTGGDALRPRGLTDADGVFRLTSYARHDGAPPGEYDVGLTWTGPRPKAADDEEDPALNDSPPAIARKDFFNGKYSNPKTSGLRVKIDAGQRELSPIVLNQEEPLNLDNFGR